MRMGLPVIAADLNPVAVLINKAMLEILPRFANHPPFNPDSKKKYHPDHKWTNAHGLAEDVRYYGRLINEDAKKRIGHLYPPVTLSDGRTVPVLTYFWARTVQCPNPACGCQMPLVGSFILKKRGKETYYVSPIIERNGKNSLKGFEVHTGEPEVKGTIISKSGARCIACNEVIAHPYIRQEGIAKRISHRLMAVSADTGKGRAYLFDPNQEQQILIEPKWIPEIPLAHNPKNISPPLYGMTSYDQLFTKRQLIAYDTLNELIIKLRLELTGENVNEDYIKAVVVFLSFAIDRLADFNNSLTTWKPSGEQQMHLYIFRQSKTTYSGQYRPLWISVRRRVQR
ncbi:hypothetical protein GCM10023189_36840 [Nibrella saemangeumensis]|uniref:Uncharacterized protein n=2 Tax=Nibrella saemangeumensis TaxID=1084526 RepID=A0ABP8N7L5_9BACT